MKSRDISNALGNINLKYVEEAQRYTAPKINFTKMVSLVACLAIILTAIPVAVIMNREDTNDKPVVTTPVQDIVVTPGGENKSNNIIYVDSLMMKKEGLIKQAFNDENVEIKNITEFSPYQCYYANESKELAPDINVPAELNFTIGGITVNATLKSYYLSKGHEKVTDEYLKEGIKIAEYSINKINGSSEDIFPDRQWLYYNVGTKQIIGFNLAGVIPMSTKEKSTKEEILEKAQQDIAAFYGKDFISKYSIEVVEIFYEFSNEWAYYVTFDRLIDGFEGYQINEKFMLYYNGSGELWNLGSSNLDSFNHIESKLTESVIKDAEEKANKLLEGRLVNYRRLSITPDGIPYVYYNYYLKEEEITDYETTGGFRIPLIID